MNFNCKSQFKKMCNFCQNFLAKPNFTDFCTDQVRDNDFNTKPGLKISYNADLRRRKPGSPLNKKIR